MKKHSLANTDHPQMWVCPDCSTSISLHPDEDHSSNDWTREFIAEHEKVHESHLDRHNGDREMMRLALRFPALHAGVIKVHGPDLTDQHRHQLFVSTGIRGEDGRYEFVPDTKEG